MLKRKHCGGSTRRDAEFVVDVLNMVVHRAFGEDQSHSDLAVAAAVGKEAEHLDLSIAQPLIRGRLRPSWWPPTARTAAAAW